MDQPDIDPDLHLQALKGLSRLNYFSNSVSLLWKPLHTLALANPDGFSVLDVATGSGDIPLALSKKAKQAGINIKFSQSVGAYIRSNMCMCMFMEVGVT